VLRYTVRRVLYLVPVLAGITVMTFAILRSIPGDPAIVMFPNAPEATIQRVRGELGLNDPLPVQYLIYVRNVLQGDLGTSIRSREPVLDTLLRRLRFTLILTVASIVVALVVGITLGVLAAVNQDGIVDHAITVAALAIVSIPNFWLGLMLMMLFAGQLRLLPAGGAASPLHYVLPVTVIGLGAAAVITRFTRSAMLEVLRQDYVRAARAHGLSEDLVVYKHALRNALNPVITVTGLEFGFLLGGAAIVESVFAVPGIGRLMVDAIYTRDYPVIQGGILFVAVIFVLVNLLTDLAYAAVNPRIRYS